MEYLPCRNKQNFFIGINRIGQVSACVCLCTALCVLMYLSIRAFLQRGLYHNVALHAHLELRNLGRHTGITRRPQCSQELASSDSVHDHSPILAHSEQQVRVDTTTATLFHSMM